MVAVALGMRDAVKGDERQILLHREAGLAGQILAGEEGARRRRQRSSAPRARR